MKVTFAFLVFFFLLKVIIFHYFSAMVTVQQSSVSNCVIWGLRIKTIFAFLVFSFLVIFDWMTVMWHSHRYDTGKCLNHINFLWLEIETVFWMERPACQWLLWQHNYVLVFSFFFLDMHVSWWLQVVYIDIFFRRSQLSSRYIPHCIVW